MNLPFGNILVSVDHEQNEMVSVAGEHFFTAKRYSDNWREKSPAIAKVEQGFRAVKKGMMLVCHYTHFHGESPYLIDENLYSIPTDDMILAEILPDGSLKPLFGNLIVERTEVETKFELPPDYIKQDISKVITAFSSEHFKKNTTIYVLNYAPYDIFYIWKGVQKIYSKVHYSEVVGYAVIK